MLTGSEPAGHAGSAGGVHFTHRSDRICVVCHLPHRPSGQRLNLHISSAAPCVQAAATPLGSGLQALAFACGSL